DVVKNRSIDLQAASQMTLKLWVTSSVEGKTEVSEHAASMDGRGIEMTKARFSVKKDVVPRPHLLWSQTWERVTPPGLGIPEHNAYPVRRRAIPALAKECWAFPQSVSPCITHHHL